MRAPITSPQGANPRWSLDFVSDVLADGRRFRVLVISTCPAFDPYGGAALLNVASRLRGWGAAFVGGLHRSRNYRRISRARLAGLGLPGVCIA
jgi:hypothetical protein